MKVVPLTEANRACGRKAHGLAALLRAGFPVPDGFVVTGPAADFHLIASYLHRLRTRAVAVRSSGVDEDGKRASFAGQLETVLGVRGIEEVMAAIERCTASARSRRAQTYRTHLGLDDEAGVPVIVQELIEADYSGVLFTRDPRSGDDTPMINASWGLGESVVSGAVVPDELTVTPPTDTVQMTIGSKLTRLDLGDNGLMRSPVPEPDQIRGCLTLDEVAQLVALGRRCEQLFGEPQDIEWAARDGQIWILQSRPITTLDVQPAPADGPRAGSVLATGVPSSSGQARGPARLVRSVDDFSSVRRGDVLVCRTTDPAWTPLFRLVAGVVTETGGVLCHAAIVAREYGIPAVVGAKDAMTRLSDGQQVVVDGVRGSVTAVPTLRERHA